MNPSEAAAVLREEVKFRKEDTKRQRNSKLKRASNALRNAEMEVLRGNPSPSAPGELPGTVSGTLMRSWTPYHSVSGDTGVFGITCGASYAGYLQNGTRKMAARPFVDKIQEAALPEIMGIFSEIGG